MIASEEEHATSRFVHETIRLLDETGQPHNIFLIYDPRAGTKELRRWVMEISARNYEKRTGRRLCLPIEVY
jgi:hypothetical protein